MAVKARAVRTDRAAALDLVYARQKETAENLCSMWLLDEQYSRTPFYGSRRMVIALGEQGWEVEHDNGRPISESHTDG